MYMPSQWSGPWLLGVLDTRCVGSEIKEEKEEPHVLFHLPHDEYKVRHPGVTTTMDLLLWIYMGTRGEQQVRCCSVEA